MRRYRKISSYVGTAILAVALLNLCLVQHSLAAPEIPLQVAIEAKFLQINGSDALSLGTIPFSPREQLAAKTLPGADLSQIERIIKEQGGLLDKVVAVPEGAGGGNLLSISKPMDGAVALESTLATTDGVEYIEYIWCRKFLPGEAPTSRIPGSAASFAHLLAGEMATLVAGSSPVTQVVGAIETPAGQMAGSDTHTLLCNNAPSVENAVAGNDIPWDSSSPAISQPEPSSSTGNEFHSVTRGETFSSEIRIGWECYKVRIPIEYPEYPEDPGTVPPPPVEYDNLSCTKPGLTPLPGLDPKVRVEYPPEKNFPYPRPIPLQARLQDWDELKVVCDGCGGGRAENVLYLEDVAKKYDWTLVSGKGSLNQPFGNEKDWDSIIADLKAQIKTLEDKISDLQKKKDDLDADRDARRAELDRQIEEQRQNKRDLQKEIDDLGREIKEFNERIQEKEKEIASIKAEIKELEEKITLKFDEIKELQDNVDGKPTGEEKRLAAELEALQQKIEAKKQEIAQQESSSANEEQSLRQAYNSSLQGLDNARQSLNRMRLQVKAKQDEISNLERRLFTGTALRDFIGQRTQILLKSQNLKSRFFSDSSIADSPASDLLGQALNVIRSNPGQQAGLVDHFNKAREDLLGQLKNGCDSLSGTDITSCRSDVNQFERELNKLSKTVSEAAQQPLMDPEIWKKLEKAKSELAQLNQSALNAESAVKSAEKAATQAHQTYLDGVTRLTADAMKLNEELTRLQEEETELSLKLKGAQNEAAIDRELNTPDWLKQITEIRQEIEQLYADIASKRLESETAENQLFDLQKERDELVAQQEVKRQKMASIDAYIAELEAKKAALETETADIDEKIATANSELNDLKAELAKAEAEAALANTRKAGNKTIKGTQLVWFIPPPLEEIMQDKNKFEELIKEVSTKEAEYKAAVTEKAALQKEAYDIIKGMNEQLWALKTAKSAIDTLTTEIKSLNDDKAEKETQFNVEQQGKLSQAQTAKNEAEAEKSEKDSKLDAAKNDEQQQQQKIDQSRQDVEAKEQAVAGKEDNVFEKINGYQIDRQNRQAKERSLADQRNQHEETKSDLRSKGAELQRISDQLNRAISTDDDATAARLRSQVESIAGELRELNEQVDSEEQSLKSAGDDFKLATVRESSSKEAEEQAQQELFRAQRDLRNARRDLRKDTEDLDAAQEKKLDAERKVKLAEADLERANASFDKARKDLAAGTADHVADTNEEIGKKEEAKTEAEGNLNDAKNKLDSLVADRNAWKGKVAAAKPKVQTAWDAWKKAESDLKTFLEGELKKVDLHIKLKLETEDAGLGAWRTGDDKPIIRIIKIDYNHQREPKIDPSNDDFIAKPPGRNTSAICNPTAVFEEATGISVLEKPQKSKEPKWDTKPEPQTAVLYYKDGEPLYDKWPPVMKEQNRVMQRAAWPWKSAAADGDRLVTTCSAGGGVAILVGGGFTESSNPVSESEYGESNPMACKDGGPEETPVIDHPVYNWPQDLLYSNSDELKVYMKVPDITTSCKAKMKVEVRYTDPGNQAEDDETKKLSDPFERFAGMKGDASEEENEFGPGDKVELRLQIFDGAHKGLDKEKIIWDVTDYKPEVDEEEAPKYGLTSDKEKHFETKTKNGGYSKVDFYMDEKWGIATVKVKWMRDSECETQEITISRLLTLSKLDVSFAPEKGWKEAKELFAGSGATDYEALAEKLPDGPVGKVIFATGLLDALNDPVDGKKILYSVEEPDDVSMDPEEVETEVYGLAWSFAGEPSEEDAVLKMLAKIEEKLEKVTKPKEVKGDQSTGKTNRFRVGVPGNYLTIEADEDFVPGAAAISGTGKLIIEGSGVGIPAEFATLTLEFEGIEFEASDADEEAPIAKAGAGTVKWDSAKAGVKPFEQMRFKFELEKILLVPGTDGGIEANLTLPGDDQKPIKFSAIIGPKGFYASISDFPEVKIGGFKLKQGAAVDIDMHDRIGPSPAQPGWTEPRRGVLIKQGEVQLPDAMKGKAENPPSIRFTNLQITHEGLTGKIAVDYTIQANLGKMALAVESFELDLEKSKPTGGTIKGSATFPDPFIGEVKAEVSIAANDEYKVTFKTDEVVNAPKLGLAFKLVEATGEYKDQIFSFELSAVLTSENFKKQKGASDIVVRRFKFDSNGNIEAEEIRIDMDVEFGKGFKITLGSLAFKKTADEFEMSLNGIGFQFGSILTADEIDIAIITGPVIKEFKLHIEVDRKPVTIEADIKYSASVFEGSVKVDVNKVFEIDGIFILGAKDNEGDPYQFWYVELNVGGRIPIGQTGLLLLKIGGGVGYNYDPPIGSVEGAPRKSDSFSFKAAINIGDASGGNVFEGRLAMVLVTNRFSLNGKVWLLTKEESLYGEGLLNLHTEPSKVDGFVRMVVALPGSEGKFLNFTGQIDFRYEGSSNWAIKSRTLEGSVLKVVLGKGDIDIKPGQALFEGDLTYDLSKDQDVGVGTLKIEVHLVLNTKVTYVVTESSTNASASGRFTGTWDVNLETRVKNFDIISGSFNAQLSLSATNSRVTVSGSANVSWDTWVHSGSRSVDIGYSG